MSADMPYPRFCKFFIDLYFLTAVCAPALCHAQVSLYDPSFLTGLSPDGEIHSILSLENGQILIGGYFATNSTSEKSGLVRLDGDGRLIGDFETGTGEVVYRLLQQPDGKILVAGGFNTLQGATRLNIGRLQTNGLVDMDFDAGTLLETNRTGSALNIQPDGKILVATFNDTVATVSRLYRLQTNGLPDETFIQTNLFGGWLIYSLFTRTNGSILVGGGFSTVNGFVSDGLVLLNPDGSLDANFNAHLTNSTVFSIVEQTNGNLLVAGNLCRDGDSSTPLLRLTAQLQWDPSFNPDPFEGNTLWDPFIRSVLLQPDGKIVIGGQFLEVGGYWRGDIARLDSEGHVDPNFDPGLGFFSYLGVICLARQDDGRILVGGSFVSFERIPCSNIIRLLPQTDGNPPRVYLFGTDGGYWPYSTYEIAATFPPGGTNCIQYSTNLVDWEDGELITQPIIDRDGNFFSDAPMFFRAKQER